ncbi:MAG: ABC transporter permease, partial [Clostridia bacterium]|nr:ABC transporter permease [Clostridia bacterium]
MKKKVKEHGEPLFHIAKRPVIPFYQALLIRVITIVVAFAVCALLAFLLIRANPIQFISTMFKGSFETPHKMWVMAKNTAILLGIALALTPAFRMRFWNIGAEGQVLVGALASVACVIYLGDSVPNALLLVIMFVAALLAGGIWGGLPAIFKAKWNTNETLFTLMMNYVASLLVSICLSVWIKSGQSSLPAQPSGHLPQIYNDSLLVVLIVLVLTGLM